MISIFKVIHYYLQMDQQTLEENVLQYINLIIFIFLSVPGLAWKHV